MSRPYWNEDIGTMAPGESRRPKSEHLRAEIEDSEWAPLGRILRIQGDESIPPKTGDFSRASVNVPHGMRAVTQDARALAIFSAPRPADRSPGFGARAGLD